MPVEIIPTLWSMAIGMMGAIIWWAYPPQAKKAKDVLLRLILGMVIGFLANVAASVSPFDAAGNWNVAGVIELLGLGFGGIAGISSTLPKKYGKYLNAEMEGEEGPQQGRGPPAVVTPVAKPGIVAYDVDVLSENDEEEVTTKLREGAEYIGTLLLGGQKRIILRKPKQM